MPADDPVELHNALQREYFGRRIKKTMLPQKTPYVCHHVEVLMACLDLESGARLLEVGAGLGRHAFMLAEMGFQVEGLELSPFLVAKFQELVGPQPPFPMHCGDIHSFPPELRGRFDAVVGFFVLHHLADLPRAFASMKLLLKPGGKIGFVEPNPLNPLYYLQIFLTPGMSWKAERGILHMHAPRLRGLLQGAGFAEVGVKRFGFFPPLLANRRWLIPVERALERRKLLQPVLPFQAFWGTQC